ncbi:hypothetical protein [Paractinoplanes hotanensis]|uniref:Abi-like protein n=1 Tax=Paractinoplanes hotanensis TaxID=2906497 RepID=A0ABT0XXH7_9ACTN|nr:hypothetical protein [Actinoplanes hotanensis]MCM4078490.1 hypothetical protein [Actinoplanes hotanensis]
MSRSEPDAEWVKRFLSVPRFRPYVRDCGGNEALALALYRWNIEVSSALHPALNFLEVLLRNAFHNELTSHYVRSAWWTVARLAGDGALLIAGARRRLNRTCRHEPTSDDVVAAMPLGFWVSLLNRDNEEVTWRPALHRAFRPGYRGPRREIHAHLEHLRMFRNRVMHHEPVHMRHLEADHQRIYELAEYLAPGAAKMLRPVDRLAEVLARRPVPYLGRRRPGLTQTEM